MEKELNPFYEQEFDKIWQTILFNIKYDKVIKYLVNLGFDKNNSDFKELVLKEYKNNEDRY